MRERQGRQEEEKEMMIKSRNFLSESAFKGPCTGKREGFFFFGKD
jgi:hypothetical protein